ncbi:ABC-2 type transport system ATP-binding protein [Paenibacillus sediminis]|uniref:ABC-2 type transport system ATP-binding protein n=2 Tax=Paenibacillus sediminis TaxID=664909 RepID=A0ABS4H2M7_9BACL|nr:ABC-2 type transport system ATP-binding protein [Paenibacillus sediminis]
MTQMIADDSMVTFENVGKKFQRKSAVKDVSFTIPKGEIIGIIGTNGSGKSTILKLMAGLLKPTQGRIFVDGKAAQRLTTQYVAFLPEQDVYYSEHTIGQTLRFYSQMYSDFDLGKALELIEEFKLQLEQKVSVLSKGNRARLKIVLALSRDVPLIIMDEPLSGLDPLVRESIIRSLISSVDMEKQTVVLTTHEVNEVEPLLDRAMLIRNGEVLGYESIEQIQSERGIGLVDWMRTLLA